MFFWKVNIWIESKRSEGEECFRWKKNKCRDFEVGYVGYIERLLRELVVCGVKKDCRRCD